MEISQEHLTYIIDHVFLPLKLPQKYDPDSPSKDAALAQYIAETAQSFRATLESPGNEEAVRTWKILEKMLNNVAILHRKSHLIEEDVEAALVTMRTEGKLAQKLNVNLSLIERYRRDPSLYCLSKCRGYFPED
jgi:hypothetical protein